MKKTICLAIFLVLVYAGYQYLQASINFSRLSGRIDVIISDPQSFSIDSMREYILAEAAKQEISLASEDIEIAVRNTDKSSLGEKLIERPGIAVESKVLVIHFDYPVRIPGMSKTFSYDVEKVFTAKTSIPDPYRTGPVR